MAAVGLFGVLLDGARAGLVAGADRLADTVRWALTAAKARRTGNPDGAAHPSDGHFDAPQFHLTQN